MHYTLTTPEGQVIDSSAGGTPLTYLHGANNIVPGLEGKLTGHVVGDRIQAIVPPSEGYGERTGPGPQAVPRDRFPAGEELHAGMQILAQGPDGQPFPLWIAKVEQDNVYVDHNHPLAGVTLHFDVEVTGIRAATAEELAHGHPHD